MAVGSCAFATAVEADYPCLCSYQIEAAVLAEPKSTAKVDSYMYEFDCRAYYTIPGLDKAYAAVGNENKYGYVKITPDTQIQVCQGAIPQTDLVTTTPIPATTPVATTITTTPIPTTTTAATTITTTPIPTTTTAATTTTTTPIPTTTPLATTTTIATTTHPTAAITTHRATTTHRPTTITTTTTTPTTITSTTTTPTTSTATSPMSTITTQPTTIPTTPMPTTTTSPTTRPTTTISPTTITTTTTRTATPTPLTTILTQTTQLSNQAYCTSLLRSSNTQYVTLNGTFCYEYVNKNVSWENARNDCKNRNGTLLEIASETTNDFIVNFIGKIGQIQPIWTGLHDRSNEEKWMWDTGTSLIQTRYTNWMPSRYIDQYHVTEDCCVLVWNRGGQWDDVDCDGTSYNEFTSKAYICQFKIPGTP